MRLDFYDKISDDIYWKTFSTYKGSIISGSGSVKIYFENFDVGSTQYGLSFMFEYKPNSKFVLKFYSTTQKTTLNGIKDVRFNTTDTKISIDNASNTMNAITLSNTNMTLWSEKLTPTIYGSFILNYMPTKKWNVNLNSYMYSKQVFAGIPFFNIVSDYTGIFYNNFMTIKPYAILNAKVIYNVKENTRVFASFRNMLGKHREFGFTDNIGTSPLFGFQWNY